VGALTGEKAAIAERIAESCRILGKLDLTHGAFGHVSYRAEGSPTILIKGKGIEEAGVRYTEVADILEVDFDAEKVDGPDGLQPPSESFIHLWLYRANPELRSVIHIHPEHAVLLTIVGRELLPIVGAYDLPAAQMAIEGVRTYPRSVTVSNDELGEEFARFVGDAKVVMMQAHGITAAGSSIEEATVRCLTLNRLVTMMYKACLLGEPRSISDEDIAVLGRPTDPSRRRGSAGGEAGMLASYRYYRELAGEDATAR
jgi:L-fuculose-phosphate aldolase